MARYYHSDLKPKGGRNMGEDYERSSELVGKRRSSHMPDEFNDEKKHERGDERAAYRKFRASDLDEGFYAGSEPRRRQEMQDAGMIYEDPRAIANLPQEVMIKSYPQTGPYLAEGLEDSINGVDHQMDYDDSQRRKHFYPKKH